MIKINIGPTKTLELDLDVSQMINGDLMITNHPRFDIVVSEASKKIVTLPKDREDTDSYKIQSELMNFLSRAGVVDHSKVEGALSYGALECPLLTPVGDRNVVKAALYCIDKFLQLEEGEYDRVNEYDDSLERMFLNPEDRISTELGDVPHEEEKGSMPARMEYWWGRGMYGYF